MPPKYPPIQPHVHVRRPSLDPTEPNDAHDVLCVMDMVDALDAMPVELTKCLADLRELDAVLNSTITHLTTRLGSLSDILNNPDVRPSDRFQTLLEIAEELTRFKLGGEDKIRVAGAACEMLVTHQQHLNDLISGSTLLVPHPSSSKPAHVLPLASTSKRPRNSPMPARNADGTAETPTKKKRVNKAGLAAVTAAAADDWDDESIMAPAAKSPAPAKKAAAAKDKKTQKVKAAATSRLSPADSLVEKATGAGVREGTPAAKVKEDAKAARQSPALSMGASVGIGSDEAPARPVKAARTTAKKAKNGDASKAAAAAVVPVEAQYQEGLEVDENGIEAEADHQLYCYCQKASYGEMIGCDADDCPIEWFHLACTNMEKPPEGDWMCNECSERYAKGKPKRKTQAKRRK